MRKKVLLQLLQEREERIAQLEQRVNTVDALIEGYRDREKALVDALTHAHETAAKVIADAQAQAKAITDSAQAEVDAELERAKRQSAQLLKQTELTVAEYENTIAEYNAVLEKAAAEAAANAERFASFSRGKRIPSSELGAEVEGLHEIPMQNAVDLPDPSGSPAQLMQNIYKLQNRIPPEQDEPAEEKIDAEVPTVKDVVAEEQAEAYSLDELLEEIIKAGESYRAE